MLANNWFEQQIRAGGVPPMGSPTQIVIPASPVKAKDMGPVDEVRGRALTTVNSDDFSPKPTPKTSEAD